MTHTHASTCACGKRFDYTPKLTPSGRPQLRAKCDTCVAEASQQSALKAAEKARKEKVRCIKKGICARAGCESRAIGNGKTLCQKHHDHMVKMNLKAKERNAKIVEEMGGNRCPMCDHAESKTLDTRPSVYPAGRRRRRKCWECGFIWKTIEVNE